MAPDDDGEHAALSDMGADGGHERRGWVMEEANSN